MCSVVHCWCLLVWAGSAGAAATSYVCHVAGTIQAPLTSVTQTLDILEADLRLVPHCLVHNGLVHPVDCKVDAEAVVQFWLTCDPVIRSSYGCQNQTWFQKHASIRVKDLTASATSSFGSPLIPSPTKHWDNEWYAEWQTKLTKGFKVNQIGFNFADVEITWKAGHRPAPGDRIHLHTSINHMSGDENVCAGDIHGSGYGASSLKVGKWSGQDDIFRKWSRARVSSESASRHSWVAIGVLLAGSAVVLQAVLTRRWRRVASAQLERSTGDAGVMDRLVQREETNDWVL